MLVNTPKIEERVENESREREREKRESRVRNGVRGMTRLSARLCNKFIRLANVSGESVGVEPAL
jgi:hypothetical protein